MVKILRPGYVDPDECEEGRFITVKDNCLVISRYEPGTLYEKIIAVYKQFEYAYVELEENK